MTVSYVLTVRDGTDDERGINLLGALALALTDRVTDAIAREHGGLSHRDAEALSTLRNITDSPSIDVLARVLGLTHSGTVRLVDRLGALGLVSRARILLLTTVGRRTGRKRTTPMMYHRDGDGLFVIASNVGAPQHPDWYHNLVADPHVTVETHDDAFAGHARPLEGDARASAWTMLKELYPFFADHEAATARTIPVVRLTKT